MLLRAAILALSCTHVPGVLAVEDPLEPLNRATYGFNQRLDQWLLRPLARGYRQVTPGLVRQGIGNFFGNLADGPIALNQFLQGKFIVGASDVARVLVNSTFGLGGILDVAARGGLEKHQEDFGQTLAVWGIEPGPYLVLPLFGPSTFRDALGSGVEGWIDPLLRHDDVPVRNSLYGLRVVHQRHRLLGADRLSSGDGYEFLRDAWELRREDLVRDGRGEDPFLDEDW